MEGWGYWLFLIIMYLLSVMMKRKQKLHVPESEQSREQWRPRKIINELFTDLDGGNTPFFDEQLTEKQEDYPEEETVEIETTAVVEAAPLVEHHLKRNDLSVIDEKIDLSTIKRQDTVKVKRNVMLFHSMDDVTRAIILKEILGKPRAYQRRIR